VDVLGWPEVGVGLPLVLIAGFPNTLRNIFVRHLVEHPIACKNYKVVALLNLKASNFWLSFNNILVASSVI